MVQRPISRSAVVAWCISAVLVINLAAYASVVLGRSISLFDHLFKSLGGKLPAATRYYLALGDGGATAIYLVSGLIPIVCMAVLRDDRRRLIIAIACATVFFLHLRLLLAAVLDPMLELDTGGVS
jgi:hypothetical protein